jgi:hypothetical protein
LKLVKQLSEIYQITNRLWEITSVFIGRNSSILFYRLQLEANTPKAASVRESPNTNDKDQKKLCSLVASRAPPTNPTTRAAVNH